MGGISAAAGTRRGWAKAGSRFGILSNPTTAFGRLFRRSRSEDYYIVRIDDALAVLARSDSWAVEWWRENTPHLLEANRELGFPASVCEVVK